MVEILNQVLKLANNSVPIFIVDGWKCSTDMNVDDVVTEDENGRLLEVETGVEANKISDAGDKFRIGLDKIMDLGVGIDKSFMLESELLFFSLPTLPTISLSGWRVALSQFTGSSAAITYS